MAEIDVTPNGPGSWRVEVQDGDRTTAHLVSVPDAVLEQLGLHEGQAELLVRTSFEFLLEREPPDAILAEFPLHVIGRYFPEYFEDMGRRLS